MQYIPLVLENHGREFARYNLNDTWTIAWDEVLQLAALDLAAADWADKATIGMARLLLAARHNYYEIPMSEAKRLADDAEAEAMLAEQGVCFPF